MQHGRRGCRILSVFFLAICLKGRSFPSSVDPHKQFSSLKLETQYTPTHTPLNRTHLPAFLHIHSPQLFFSTFFLFYLLLFFFLFFVFVSLSLSSRLNFISYSSSFPSFLSSPQRSRLTPFRHNDPFPPYYITFSNTLKLRAYSFTPHIPA